MNYSECSAQDDSTAVIQNVDTSSMLFKHSPIKASFYSALLPGLGQIYNKKYWKLPLIYAGTGVLIYLIKFNQNYYSQYKTAYIKSYINDPNNPPDPNIVVVKGYHLTDQNLSDEITYYRRNRDYSVLGLAALYIANIIDATVDAYLFDYSVNQDLSLHLDPTFNPFLGSNNLGISCTLRF